MEQVVNQTVMVHPDLTSDPVNMQAQLGTITHLVDEESSAYVRFNNGVIGLYATDALLMLIPPEIVLDKLRTEVDLSLLEASEVVDIMEMYQLHATGLSHAKEEALDWAMTHERISKAIVFSVEDWVEFQFGRSQGQQQPGRGL
ncbi:hypothetical protein [Elizabethkingia anophelis]|uniref:hypothetical protein n=1 Tax=Elizabethkingia anophelis TaxID=1117645 RepID=UPI0012B413E6|nr:hypothetical protein [Elizabethkingia anophelis]QGN22518.1 hypothetical protein GJV56_07705 [Elizabethkingia anophelis]QNV09170.1 hypothetical protein EIY88_07685 [Elizabethkingia anophelis]UTF90926.1 hypothetical protein J2N93_07750 [Elizabethkingia anophelis]UTG01796.1 hypothetical protein J2O04_07755 [Elizabethkingia anophelis]UTG05546.1 hypothetical protein J2O03_07750 [Elizabethkingia anophelis]